MNKDGGRGRPPHHGDARPTRKTRHRAARGRRNGVHGTPYRLNLVQAQLAP